MNDNKTMDASTDDLAWARKLKNRVGRQILRTRADAIVADALGTAIKKQQLWRVEFLLQTPLPSLFTRQPTLPNPNSVFADAWQGLSDAAREKARYRFSPLYDNHRTSPLTAAVLAGFNSGVELLLAKGAAPFYRSSASPSGYGGALGAAIFLGKYDAITLLMSQPVVKQELETQPKFRNYLLHTALGTDCAATLAHLAKCDPDLLEKGRVYGDHKAEEYTLGDGIFAYREKLKLQRAFEASQNAAVSKYGHPPKNRKPSP